jgi:3-hydroxyacyl-CoA dehydrogenase / 3-hydroxy-2-methylbutyryl-CoA dehydrogenase
MLYARPDTLLPSQASDEAVTYNGSGGRNARDLDYAHIVDTPSFLQNPLSPLFIKMQIQKRTFLISGGSSGLGLSTALALLAAGANVSILDLNPPPTSHPDLSNEQRTLFTNTDVSSSASLQSAVTSTVRWCQRRSAPLSGVICCAGIGTAATILPKQAKGTTHDNVKYMDMSLFDKTLAINLRGTVDLMRLAIPHLSLNEPWGSDGERGIAIIVSSVAAYEGQVGQLAYSASKGAVASIVLPLARELGQKAGIRVLGVAPGVFETGMTVPKSKPLPVQKMYMEASKAEWADASKKPKASMDENQKEWAAASKKPQTKMDANQAEWAQAAKSATSPPSSSKTPQESGGGNSTAAAGDGKKAPTGARAGINPEMVNYPMRMGRGDEFGILVKHMIENPMLNGFVVRLDGGVRMPSRL